MSSILNNIIPAPHIRDIRVGQCYNVLEGKPISEQIFDLQTLRDNQFLKFGQGISQMRYLSVSEFELDDVTKKLGIAAKVNLSYGGFVGSAETKIATASNRLNSHLGSRIFVSNILNEVSYELQNFESKDWSIYITPKIKNDIAAIIKEQDAYEQAKKYADFINTFGHGIVSKVYMCCGAVVEATLTVDEGSQHDISENEVKVQAGTKDPSTFNMDVAVKWSEDVKKQFKNSKLEVISTVFPKNDTYDKWGTSMEAAIRAKLEKIQDKDPQVPAALTISVPEPLPARTAFTEAQVKSLKKQSLEEQLTAAIQFRDKKNRPIDAYRALIDIKAKITGGDEHKALNEKLNTEIPKTVNIIEHDLVSAFASVGGDEAECKNDFLELSSYRKLLLQLEKISVINPLGKTAKQKRADIKETKQLIENQKTKIAQSWKLEPDKIDTIITLFTNFREIAAHDYFKDVDASHSIFGKKLHDQPAHILPKKEVKQDDNSADDDYVDLEHELDDDINDDDFDEEEEDLDLAAPMMLGSDAAEAADPTPAPKPPAKDTFSDLYTYDFEIYKWNRLYPELKTVEEAFKSTLIYKIGKFYEIRVAFLEYLSFFKKDREYESHYKKYREILLGKKGIKEQLDYLLTQKLTKEGCEELIKKSRNRMDTNLQIIHDFFVVNFTSFFNQVVDGFILRVNDEAVAEANELVYVAESDNMLYKDNMMVQFLSLIKHNGGGELDKYARIFPMIRVQKNEPKIELRCFYNATLSDKILICNSVGDFLHNISGFTLGSDFPEIEEMVIFNKVKTGYFQIKFNKDDNLETNIKPQNDKHLYYAIDDSGGKVGREGSLEDKFKTQLSLELVTQSNYDRFKELKKEVIRGKPMFKSVDL